MERTALQKVPVLLFLFIANLLQAQTKVSGLLCEHLVNPLGIDVSYPRLSWQLSSNSHNIKQQSFQLCVGTDSLAVTRMKGNDWLLKRTSGDQMITYKGKDLKALTKYFWSVIIIDNKGNKVSATSSFETGMIDQLNWKGSWISDSRNINLKPSGLFRKSFSLNKKIVSARAYIAVAGLYELYLNGQRIGNHRLDPIYTRFDRRNLYVTYDVTSNIVQGDNVIGVMLGNGWYNHQSTAVWDFDKAPWRNRPSFCMDLRITFADGTTQTVSTGRDWKTIQGPVIFNSIYTGEHYDANKEIPDWNNAKGVDTAWKQVIYVAAPSGNIAAQSLVPIVDAEQVPARQMTKLSDTAYVFDLGRNIAGVSEIRLSGERGTVIRLKHGERLYANGHVDQSNIDVHYRPKDNTDPFGTDIYILKGEGEERFRPRFNYKGFQYVEVTSNKPVSLSRENLVGYFMHSEVKPVGIIQSSDSIINKIWRATNNSYLSNLFGYPTDCPQREKNGWTGDAAIAVETGLYNFDGITVYEKWMADHRDEQQPNGVLPSIVPTGGWGYEWGNGPDWTSTISIIPWNLYLFYGDSKALSDNYDHIKRYVDHINELYPSGLVSWGLGDWVPVKSVSPVELTSTCYYYADVMILANAARLFGKQKDLKYYAALASRIKTAFTDKYLDTTNKVYGKGTQTEMAVPLYWGIVPDKWKPTVAKNLAKRVEEDSLRLDVGLLGTKAILNALSENGYADLAFKLASSRTYPSWGWWMVNGATTLYENWKIDAANDISMNHIMFGEIGAWFYKALGGIRPDPAQPGFKNILLEPYFVKGLDSFSCYHDGPFGRVFSSWRRVKNQIEYEVTVPANSTATLILKGKKLEISSGTYHYSLGDSYAIIP
ncbi:MAG TPA: family 78 glycoside hydrolase catalytic domain [Flavisolibacter sp.]|nr:family 78 glycoside hydrolase catalytic domain [Flavisolibacter sp.]